MSKDSLKMRRTINNTWNTGVTVTRATWHLTKYVFGQLTLVLQPHWLCILTHLEADMIITKHCGHQLMVLTSHDHDADADQVFKLLIKNTTSRKHFCINTFPVSAPLFVIVWCLDIVNVYILCWTRGYFLPLINQNQLNVWYQKPDSLNNPLPFLYKIFW